MIYLILATCVRKIFLFSDSVLRLACHSVFKSLYSCLCFFNLSSTILEFALRYYSLCLIFPAIIHQPLNIALHQDHDFVMLLVFLT